MSKPILSEDLFRLLDTYEKRLDRLEHASTQAASGGSTAGRVNLPHTFSVAGPIAVSSGDNDHIPGFFVPTLATGQTATLIEVRAYIRLGTSVTFDVVRGLFGAGTNLTTGLTATTTPQNHNITDVALAAGDYIRPIVTAVSGTPNNMTLTYVVQYVTGS